MNTEQPSRNPKNLTTKTRRREEILCDSSRLRVFVVNRMHALPVSSVSTLLMSVAFRYGRLRPPSFCHSGDLGEFLSDRRQLAGSGFR